MNATPSKTHVAKALGHIVAPLQGEKFRAGVAAKIQPLQDLEDLVWQILAGLSIEGSGIVLDRIGLIVGRGRNGLVDAVYRRLLRAQILVNRSNGAIPELVKILQVAVSDDAWSFKIMLGASSIEIHGFGPFDATMTDALWSLLKDAKAGGIRLEYVGDVSSPIPGHTTDDPLILAEDLDAASDGEPDEVNGIGDDLVGEPETGGSLASDQGA